jgi:hypothetical protein
MLDAGKPAMYRARPIRERRGLKDVEVGGAVVGNVIAAPRAVVKFFHILSLADVVALRAQIERAILFID